MKVEKKAVRSGILKLEKNVQITLDEDMNGRIPGQMWRKLTR